MTDVDTLIIEDQALIAENIKDQLEEIGYGIAGVVYHYEKAIDAINNLDYDLVITDIDLGMGTDEKSGIQLMEYIKTVKDCPVVFLTAFGVRATVRKAAALGPSAYLLKPVNSAHLYSSIQVALEDFNNKKPAGDSRPEQVMPDYFFTRLGKKLVKIEWPKVYHLEAVKNYVNIRTWQFSGVVPLRSSLQQVMTTMVPPALKHRFLKINRAEVIAKEIIQTVEPSRIITSVGEFACTVDIDTASL